jgi:hypothetical protein
MYFGDDGKAVSMPPAKSRSRRHHTSTSTDAFA